MNTIHASDYVNTCMITKKGTGGEKHRLLHEKLISKQHITTWIQKFELYKVGVAILDMIHEPDKTTTRFSGLRFKLNWFRS